MKILQRNVAMCVVLIIMCMQFAGCKYSKSAYVGAVVGTEEKTQENASVVHVEPSLFPVLPQAPVMQEPVAQLLVEQPVVVQPVVQQAMPLETQTKNVRLHDPNMLDFEVENDSGKTLFVACFSYIKNKDFGNWRWDKSDIYQVGAGKSVVVDVDVVTDEQDREAVFGYLAVFDNKLDADQATYQLLSDKNKLDLDRIAKLKDKKVTVYTEKYGIQGEFYDYDFVKKSKASGSDIAELDFMVQNKTGKTINITCFVYQKKAKGDWIASEEEKDDMTVWRFDKTKVLKLAPDQEALIDVDTIVTKRDRDYVRGYLAVFGEQEEKLAQDSVFEQLEVERKLNLGPLHFLENKKVIINVERYGVAQEFIDYVVKPVTRIDFSTAFNQRKN